MKRLFLPLSAALVLLHSVPAWPQEKEGLGESWTKAWKATAEAFSKTATEAADATVDALSRAREATLDAVERGARATLDTVERERGTKKAKPDPKEFEARVVRVTGGDTLVVRTGEDIDIRLYGLDAPEPRQPGGPEAEAALRQIQDQAVKVVALDVDRHGRTVGLLEHDGKSVNLGLVEQGHAWYYERHCQEQPVCSRIQAAENEARAAKKGLWAVENPTPPWTWRKAEQQGP